jgi:serine/threonine-protein kinase
LALSQPRILGGRYEVGEPIGEGNFSVTYRARDIVLGRLVAVKILRDQYASHAGFSSRFENEARAAALISHPNVIQVFDFGHEDRTEYIVMQYVGGPSLKDYMRDEGPLTVDEAVSFTRQILDGLAAIHEAGIIHRDVKPQNVLLTDTQQIKLTDFGIARLGSGSTGLTESGTAIGTAAYMAPEQASGSDVTPASDLYSVGVILYEMLTGRLPFPGDNPVQVMYRHVNELPPPPRSINRAIPVGIEAVVLRALAKNPDDRFATAQAMRDALLDPAALVGHTPRGMYSDPTEATAVSPVVAASVPPRIPPPPPPAPPAREGGVPWPRVLPILLVVVLALVIGAIAAASQFGGGSKNNPTATVPIVAVVSPTESATETPTEVPPTMTPTLEPTETPSPTVTPTNTPEPTATPTATPVPPTATPVPPTATAVPPTATAPPAPTVATDTPIPLNDMPPAMFQGPSATLNAGDFKGGYRRDDGVLYGLPAVHFYGPGSGADSGSATFTIDSAPGQYVMIAITGMDDEQKSKVPMQLWLNDSLVWEGPSPFGNEDWTDIGWLIGNLDWLQPGQNTITVVNVGDPGQIGSPPWFLVTSAVVYYK